MSIPLNILFAGSGEFGLPTLRALTGSHHRLVHVFTQPDRPAGRGRKLTPTPIGRFADENHLPVSRTPDINAESLPPADLLVVIAFGQKIAPQVVDHARLGSVNLHASLLPKYRGAAPIHRAVLGGETVTGNSVIRLAQKMDAGAVLGQSRVEIGELETTGELHDRLAADGAPLVLTVIDELARGVAVEKTQDESAATAARKLSRDDSVIDFARRPEEVARFIRGLYPWPGVHVKLVDAAGVPVARLTLATARDARRSADPALPPGAIRDDGLVNVEGGAVEVVTVVPEGRRAMSLADFRNARPWERGMRLEAETA